jgi:TIR domain
MVDVFISYSKVDRSVAEKLFSDLTDRGYRVWWDFELYAGEDFHDVILGELNKAKAAIVIWSDTAVKSRWVRGEADHAAKRNKLIPVYVAGFDTDRVPLNFRLMHAEKVNDLARIVRVLERLGVRPARASLLNRDTSSSGDFGNLLPSASIHSPIRDPSETPTTGRLEYTAPADQRFPRLVAAFLFVAALVVIGGVASRLVTTPTGSLDATVNASRKGFEVPPLAGFSGGTAEGIDSNLQATALWRVVKREFPEWYKERVDEAAALASEKKDDAAIGKHMGTKLRELRRQQAATGLQATQQRLKAVAVSFFDNLVQLRAHSPEACHALIVGGEANPAIITLLQGGKFTAGLQAQLTAMFEAIAEGRKQARYHLRPSRADFQQLTDDLKKMGWTQEDMVLFNELRKAPPEKMCQLVHDFFKAQLEVQDPEVQTKLIISALGPVFAD